MSNGIASPAASGLSSPASALTVAALASSASSGSSGLFGSENTPVRKAVATARASSFTFLSTGGVASSSNSSAHSSFLDSISVAGLSDTEDGPTGMNGSNSGTSSVHELSGESLPPVHTPRVRFSHKLISEHNAEWSDHYIAYNIMKAMIGDVLEARADASIFADKIQAEITKVDAFFLETSSELADKFRHLVNQSAIYCSASESEKLRHMEDLQKAMRDLYVQLFLLEEFGTLNVTGFAKIFSKFDAKVKSPKPIREQFSDAVANASFANTDDITVMTKELEKLYADTFEGGNRRKAVSTLTLFLQSDARTQPKQVPRNLLSKKGWIIDMDGVLYYQNHLLPGVIAFVDWLKSEKKRFLFLTNSSEKSPKELQQKLARLGIHVGEDQFYNSSQSTAEFLSRQKPNGSAFVIGEAGLISALYEVGYTMNEIDPDYVVIGETRNYNYERMQLAVNLVRRGAKLIGTNVDVYDKALNGVNPGTACLIAPIELASGSKAYYLGKPNPLMLRSAMRKLGCDAKDTVIIGDRMDTDIIGGIESGIETVLVLSGVTTMDDLKRYAYRPDHIMGSVSDIANLSKVDA